MFIDERDNNTPLHKAVADNSLAEVYRLLTDGADPNAKNLFGMTPLHIACMCGRCDIAEALILNGANVVEQAMYGNTPLAIAISTGQCDMVKLLMNYVTNIFDVQKTDVINPDDGRWVYREEPILHVITSIGNVNMMKTMLDEGADINVINQITSYTPLHLAVERGREEFVELLISRRADINIKDCNGRTPFRMALECKLYNIAKMLLEAGSHIDEPGGKCHSLLYLAVSNNFVQIVSMLIKRGTDPNKSKGRDSVLHVAVRRSEEMFRMLIKNGACLYIKNEFKFTPMENELFDGNDLGVRMILDHYKNVDKLLKDLKIGRKKIEKFIEDDYWCSNKSEKLEKKMQMVYNLIIERWTLTKQQWELVPYYDFSKHLKMFEPDHTKLNEITKRLSNKQRKSIFNNVRRKTTLLCLNQIFHIDIVQTIMSKCDLY